MVYNASNAFAAILQKYRKPAFTSTEEKQLANEARKIKETLLLSYLDKMETFEKSLPCDAEKIATDHVNLSTEIEQEFEKLLGYFSELEYVSNEREDLMRRLNSIYNELKEKNFNYSQKACTKIFNSIFQSVKNTEISYLESGELNTEQLKLAWISALVQYRDSAVGPASAAVWQDGFENLLEYFTDLIADLDSTHTKNIEILEQKAKLLARHRDESRAGENKLRAMLEETNKLFEQQLENRDEILKELKVSMNTKILQLDTKCREQAKDIHVLKLELEQVRREKELALENEKELAERRVSDYDGRYKTLKQEIAKYRQMIDELNDEKERCILEKNEAMNELAIKYTENSSDMQKEKSNIAELLEIRRMIEEVVNKFEGDTIKNFETLHAIDELTSCKIELNEYKIRHHEELEKLKKHYEEKSQNPKNSIQSPEKVPIRYTVVEAEIDVKSLKLERLLEELKSQNEYLSKKVQDLTQESESLRHSLDVREQQYSDQAEIMDLYIRQIKKLSSQIEEISSEYADSKVKSTILGDDNARLIDLIDATIPYKSKNDPLVRKAFNRIVDPYNRALIKKVLISKGIKCFTK
jgi:hypothetical protein